MKQSLMYSISLFLASLLSLTQLIAQNSTINYDLNNYQLPNMRRHVLEFNLNVSGSSGFRTQKTDDNDPLKNNRQSFSSVFSPYYSYYLNNEKFQLEQKINTQLPEINFNSGKNLTDNNRSFYLYPDLDYIGEFREYISSKLFLEQDINFEFFSSNRNTFIEDLNDSTGVYHDQTQETTSQSVNLSIPILAGWGRIERVEDARLAVYILDDLKRQDT